MCISFIWCEKAGKAYGFSLVLWQHGTCAQIMGWQTSVHICQGAGTGRALVATPSLNSYHPSSPSTTGYPPSLKVHGPWGQSHTIVAGDNFLHVFYFLEEEIENKVVLTFLYNLLEGNSGIGWPFSARCLCIVPSFL